MHSASGWNVCEAHIAMIVELLFVLLYLLQLSLGKAMTLAANPVFAHCNI
jgi:hypothetical protein